ncbi:MAG: hypothetical protein ACJ790_06490 [Myxococcaceae bacterium]
MKTLLRAVPVAVLLTLLPSTALAEVRLGLGADYQFYRRGLINLTLAVDGALARHIRVGGRFGALLANGPEVGAPIDLDVRAVLGNGKVYLEGLVGPWLMFGQSDYLFHLHGAFGFGLQSSSFEFGVEVGWLDPSAIVGLRLGFRI